MSLLKWHILIFDFKKFELFLLQFVAGGPREQWEGRGQCASIKVGGRQLPELFGIG